MTNKNSIFRLDRSIIGDRGILVEKIDNITPYPAHTHTFYEISFYTGDTGLFYINTIPHEIKKPTVVIVTPADIHSISSSNGKLSSIKVCFDNTILSDKEILPESATVFECNEDYELIKILFEEIFQNSDNIKYCATLLSAIILKVVQFGYRVIPTFNDHSYEHIAQALKYINDNFCDNISLTETAQTLHISPQYLSTIFKKNLGINFVNYVSQLRLHYSVELLSKRNISITEIAFLCGFRNFSHFLRSFKNEFGTSPGKYRKKFK